MIADDPTWHPIASSSDLPYRHCYQAQLDGRELAVWRADDDHVNVWENRCLHRGVRLSIGVNDGRELQCQYHGWRYANRTAGCTYIPAHPADAPARTICNRTYPAVERYGLLWTSLEPGAERPAVPLLEAGSPLPLRPVEVWADASLVRARLSADPLATEGEVVWFVQPVDPSRSVIRGVLVAAPSDAERLRVLRRWAGDVNKLRDRIEAEVAAQVPAQVEFMIEDLPEQLVGLPEVVPGRAAALRVVVARKWDTAEGIAAFELEPIDGGLPTFQPGAHIDVHLPNGLVRQYSLINGPGELGCYTIGVKLEPQSSGGSRCLHDTVRAGDVLAISEPRNNFPLRRDAVRTLLIAGGIGVTPLLSMAQVLHHQGLAFELHHFVRTEAHAPFRDLTAPFESQVVHVGLGPEQTAARLEVLLADRGDADHVYVCGPAPMLDAAREIAAASGWPDESVHFEYFANPNEIDQSSSFEVALARSALTLTVPSGRSILQVLRDSGIEVPSSCEQGACGTCVVTVLDGEPDHQDVYLHGAERDTGGRIVTCVSRAVSERLVLDV